MLEKIIVFIIIAAALAFVVRRFLRSAKPDGGCGCCPSRGSCPSAAQSPDKHCDNRC